MNWAEMIAFARSFTALAIRSFLKTLFTTLKYAPWVPNSGSETANGCPQKEFKHREFVRSQARTTRETGKTYPARLEPDPAAIVSVRQRNVQVTLAQIAGRFIG